VLHLGGLQPYPKTLDLAEKAYQGFVNYGARVFPRNDFPLIGFPRQAVSPHSYENGFFYRFD
jgi:hypothetical protein